MMLFLFQLFLHLYLFIIYLKDAIVFAKIKTKRVLKKPKNTGYHAKKTRQNKPKEIKLKSHSDLDFLEKVSDYSSFPEEIRAFDVTSRVFSSDSLISLKEETESNDVYFIQDITLLFDDIVLEQELYDSPVDNETLLDSCKEPVFKVLSDSTEESFVSSFDISSGSEESIEQVEDPKSALSQYMSLDQVTHDSKKILSVNDHAILSHYLVQSEFIIHDNSQGSEYELESVLSTESDNSSNECAPPTKINNSSKECATQTESNDSSNECAPPNESDSSSNEVPPIVSKKRISSLIPLRKKAKSSPELDRKYIKPKKSQSKIPRPSFSEMNTKYAESRLSKRKT
ncbi:unnamed protein product [Rhizopus stolonifer]